MTLAELLPRLAHFTAIIVTGPQRSGTTIATKIIAHELNYRPILEETFREDDLNAFASVAANAQSAVIQAPALSSVVHLFRNPDWGVVFMLRAAADIIRSQDRIAWTEGHDGYEKGKYFTDSCARPICTVKEDAWRAWQRPRLGARAFELEYESLAGHRLWVPAHLRRSFGPRQTEHSASIDLGPAKRDN